jgi:hypothetical protein
LPGFNQVLHPLFGELHRLDAASRQALTVALGLDDGPPSSQLLVDDLRRGGGVAVVSELLRAAELSPAGPERASRLAEAAYLGSIVTGDLRDAPRLLEAARQADPEHGGSLAAAVASTYHLLNGDGDVGTAHRLMVGAIETLADPGGAHNKVLIEGLYTCFWCASSAADRSCGNRSTRRSADSGRAPLNYWASWPRRSPTRSGWRCPHSTGSTPLSPG